LPAHIFRGFMTEAEQGLPVRPLAGTTLVASADEVPAADKAAPEEQKPEEKKNEPDALDRLLNKIFGGT